jgi:ATP-dependent DNA helicase PIF1
MEQHLSPEQERVLELYRAGKNIFITGAGGTGKSYILRCIIEEASSQGQTYQVCAMSGRAAVLLNCKARTLHSWSGIRLAKGKPEQIIATALKKRGATKTWRGVKLLIVDEVSMMSAKIFEIINDVAKIARKNYHSPFGGLQVIFIGDFFQLPPVGDADDIDSTKYCFDSSLWFQTFPRENHVILTQIFRQKDDTQFIKILTQIREGRITRSSHDRLCSLIGRKCENTDIVPTRLFPLRASADALNTRMFNMIEGPVYTYEADVCLKNTIYLDDGTPIMPEILRDCEKLSPEYRQNEIQNMIENSPCTNTLLLKVGAVVMLCYNLNVEMGLCNGSLGVVVGFTIPSAAPPAAGGFEVKKNDCEVLGEAAAAAAGGGGKLPLVKFTNGITMAISPQSYQSVNYPAFSFSQIPLKLAWGLTIHSSQGSTLDMAEIDIGSGIFEVGQTYVALSRVRSLDGLYLIGYDPSKIKVSKKVVDFYKEIAGGV